MTDIADIIAEAAKLGASDIHISQSMPLFFRINGILKEISFEADENETFRIISSLIPDTLRNVFDSGKDVDFAMKTVGYRLRVNVFRQHFGLCAVLRLLNDNIPTLVELGLPTVLASLMNRRRGLILVTGPTGSGKSTTLASMIDLVNSSRAEHIITIEDPIEYVYAKKKSVIHQREVGRDTQTFAAALRSASREDPNIILIGEMRDFETVEAALTAAEMGHLVLSTLHTISASQTVDRIIDACPTSTQHQVRTQLADVLAGVITQSLIPNIKGTGRLPATEIMLGTDAILNLIREDKSFQIPSFLQSGAQIGMHTMNSELSRLVSQNKITKENAVRYTNDPKSLSEYFTL